MRTGSSGGCPRSSSSGARSTRAWRSRPSRPSGPASRRGDSGSPTPRRAGRLCGSTTARSPSTPTGACSCASAVRPEPSRASRPSTCSRIACPPARSGAGSCSWACPPSGSATRSPRRSARSCPAPRSTRPWPTTSSRATSSAARRAGPSPSWPSSSASRWGWPSSVVGLGWRWSLPLALGGGLLLWLGAGWLLGAAAGTSRPCSRRSRSSARSASPRSTGSSPSARAPTRATRQLRTAREMVLHALTSLTETRDFETGAHLVRTSRYARVLGEALASHPKFRDFLTPETIDLIARLAPIHDIGKVGVADRTLRKPGPLSDDEREEMSRHPIYGRDVIARTEERVGVRDDFLLKLAKEIVYSHHERWDGSGYPEGLRGEAIPVAGRMVALVDVYDALASARVYKGALPHDEVVQAIVAGRGTHFDPDMVDAFLRIQEDWRRIAIDFADEHEEHAEHAPSAGRGRGASTRSEPRCYNGRRDGGRRRSRSGSGPALHLWNADDRLLAAPAPRRGAPGRARADPRLPLPLRRVPRRGPRRRRLGRRRALPRAGPAGPAAGPGPGGVVRSRGRDAEPLRAAHGAGTRPRVERCGRPGCTRTTSDSGPRSAAGPGSSPATGAPIWRARVEPYRPNVQLERTLDDHGGVRSHQERPGSPHPPAAPLLGGGRAARDRGRARRGHQGHPRQRVHRRPRRPLERERGPRPGGAGAGAASTR